MPIKLDCQCGKQFRVRDEDAGKKVRCPACQVLTRIPSAAVVPAVPPPVPVPARAAPAPPPPPPPASPQPNEDDNPFYNLNDAPSPPRRRKAQDYDEDYDEDYGREDSRRDRRARGGLEADDLIRKRSLDKGSGGGGASSDGGWGTNAGVGGGLLMMVIAVVWFVVGLMNNWIFFYPPVLFIIGLVAFIKGLASGSNS
jgi:hypothetical protein